MSAIIVWSVVGALGIAALVGLVMLLRGSGSTPEPDTDEKPRGKEKAKGAGTKAVPPAAPVTPVGKKGVTSPAAKSAAPATPVKPAVPEKSAAPAAAPMKPAPSGKPPIKVAVPPTPPSPAPVATPIHDDAHKRRSIPFSQHHEPVAPAAPVHVPISIPAIKEEPPPSTLPPCLELAVGGDVEGTDGPSIGFSIDDDNGMPPELVAEMVMMGAVAALENREGQRLVATKRFAGAGGISLAGLDSRKQVEERLALVREVKRLSMEEKKELTALPASVQAQLSNAGLDAAAQMEAVTRFRVEFGLDDLLAKLAQSQLKTSHEEAFLELLTAEWGKWQMDAATNIPAFQTPAGQQKAQKLLHAIRETCCSA